MSIPGAWIRVTNFQFTAHTSNIGRQDKFMPFSGLVALTVFLLFVCYSLRHARLFKLKFSYCFSKHRRYLDIFMVLAFSSQRNWGNPSSSTGIPLHFYDVLTKGSTHLFRADTGKLEKMPLCDEGHGAPLHFSTSFSVELHTVTFQQDNFIFLCLCLLCLCCLPSFERNEILGL